MTYKRGVFKKADYNRDRIAQVEASLTEELNAGHWDFDIRECDRAASRAPFMWSVCTFAAGYLSGEDIPYTDVYKMCNRFVGRALKARLGWAYEEQSEEGVSDD